MKVLVWQQRAAAGAARMLAAVPRLGAVLLAGAVLGACGGESGPKPEPAAGQPVAPQAGGRSGSGAAGGVNLIVTVADADTGEPLPAVKVVVYTQATESPSSIEVREIWTDSRGTARQPLDPAYRIAVRSEFDLKPQEVVVRGGTAEASLAVRTSFPVRGRVLDAEGRPLAGAEVAVVGAQPRKETGAALPALPDAAGGLDEFKQRNFDDLAAECRSGDDGTFEASIGILEEVVAAAGSSGYVTADWRRIGLDESQKAFGPVDIVLRRAATLRVQFVDTNGRSVPGYALLVAESESSERRRRFRESVVVPFSARGTTGADGVAVFTVPAGIDLVVQGGAGGRHALVFPAAPAGDGGPETRDFVRETPIESVRLEAGAERSVIATPPRNLRVECRVRDAAGRPVEGAAIRFADRTAVTDAQGEAVALLPLNAAEGAEYAVRRDGYAPVEGAIGLPPEGAGVTVSLDLELPPAQPLAIDPGRRVQQVWLIRDGGGEPAGRVAAGGEELLPAENLVPGTRVGETWVFGHAAAGPVDVLVQTSRFGFERVNGVMPDAGRVALDLGVAGGGSGAGEGAGGSGADAVLQGRAIPAAGARPQTIAVAIMRNDLPAVRRFDPLGVRGEAMGWAEAAAGPDGCFRVEGLVPGRYAVAAALFEWGHRTDLYGEIAVEPGDETVSIELGPPDELATLDIVASDGSGAPAAGIEILLFDPVDSPLAASPAATYFVTDDAGRVSIRRLPPGRYSFQASGLSVRTQPEQETRIIVIKPD